MTVEDIVSCLRTFGQNGEQDEGLGIRDVSRACCAAKFQRRV